MKKLYFILILFAININSKAQQLDIYTFGQLDFLFPKDYIGYGGNLSYKFRNAGTIRIGYAYQYIDKEYWYACSHYNHTQFDPKLHFNDINFAYFFNNNSDKRLKIYYGLEFSTVLIRGVNEGSCNPYSNNTTHLNYKKIYFGNELVFRYNDFPFKNISIMANLSVDIMPFGSSNDNFLLMSFLSPIIRAGVGLSYDFGAIKRKKSKKFEK